MKYWLLQIIFLLLCTQTQCQILDFSKKQPKIIPIPYDSSYYSLPDFGSAEEFEGLKGQIVLDSKGDKWILKDFTYKSANYLPDLTLVNINNGKTKRIYNNDFQDYYLEAGFERYKTRLIGVKVYPYISQQTTFVAYNDVELSIEPNKEYEITDVKYAKFKHFEYAPILELNHEGFFKLNNETNYSIILEGNAANNDIEFTFSKLISNSNTSNSRHNLKSGDALFLGGQGKRTRDYDDSGSGIFERKIVKRNWRELYEGGRQSKSNGKITVKICVDRAGDVRYTEILFDETTDTDPSNLKRALKAAKGYKFQEDKSAPPEQCGKLVFNMDINAFRGN